MQLDTLIVTVLHLVDVPVLHHQDHLLLLLLTLTTYYCESGAEDSNDVAIYYLSDPLWDGSGCSLGNNCCSNINLPWFQYQLSQMTTDDIEVRICKDEGFSNEEILIDILELYVQ